MAIIEWFPFIYIPYQLWTPMFSVLVKLKPLKPWMKWTWGLGTLVVVHKQWSIYFGPFQCIREGFVSKSFFYVKHCYETDTAKGQDNNAVTRTMRRDRLIGIFHLGQSCFDTLESTFLLFLWHHYNINEQDFFNPTRDQNIQRKKCKMFKMFQK